MARVEIPTEDSLYLQWIENFAATATTNATALGLTSGQTTMLNAMATSFANNYAASQASKIATKGLVATKNDSRTASEELFRSTAKFVNANPNVPTGLKADLGINPSPVPSGPVVTPTFLNVVGYENGDNVVTWKRTGNATGTAFVLEVKMDSASPWTILATATKVKFVHTGQIPGQRISYRVYAQRGNFQSSPSAAVSVYDETESPVLTLHEAA